MTAAAPLTRCGAPGWRARERLCYRQFHVHSDCLAKADSKKR